MMQISKQLQEVVRGELCFLYTRTLMHNYNDKKSNRLHTKYAIKQFMFCIVMLRHVGRQQEIRTILYSNIIHNIL